MKETAQENLEESGFKEHGQRKLLFLGLLISCLYPDLYFISRLHKKFYPLKK